VAGGPDGVAGAAGLEPGLPAWRVLFEATRRRHGLWGESAGVGARGVAATAGEPGSVPLPLAPSVWRSLLRKHVLPDDPLAVAIAADRRSALLYRALAALDEPTLAALAAEPQTLALLHERQAAVLAGFGARFRVRGGAVDVPGGEEAAPLWEELVGASPREPLRFLHALVRANAGRLAFLYDSVARLDPLRQRFALGMQLPGPARLDAFKELTAVFDSENAWWRVEGRLRPASRGHGTPPPRGD
jgi:hypothetical protein